MFAWIQRLLQVENIETAEEATSKLRTRMRRETERLVNYELQLSQGPVDAVTRMRTAEARPRTLQGRPSFQDAGGQA
jgi:hypothetical protein